MAPRARIGNDVVDLGDPAAAGAHRRPRWLRRVFAEEERDRVDAVAEPAALAWAMFALKEAAYKALSKERRGLVFAHRRFRVAADLGSVRYDDVVLRSAVARRGDCVHALAILGDPGLRPEQGIAEVGPGADPSAAARALLRRRLAGPLACRAAELAVVRAPVSGSWDGYGPPVLIRRGRLDSSDISLSHDGRYVAFAALLAEPRAWARANVHAAIVDAAIDEERR